MSLARYVAVRLAQAVPTLIGVLLVVFVLVRVLPGDPARLIAGPEALEEDVQRIRELLGLDRPLYEQFATYMVNVLRGDLGISLKTGDPVVKEIMARLPYTIGLALLAEVIAVLIGLPLGILAATRPSSKTDYAISVVSLVGSSMPIYWLGLMLIYLFAVEMRLLPPGGAGTPAHAVLPALTLSLFLVGNIVRITRASVIEALESNYVVTARAKGLAERVVVLRHALRTALIPVITVLGVQVGSLLGGAVLTETVFAWPGIGRLLVDSIFYRDYPVVQGVVLLTALVFVVVNIIVDVAYAYVNPKVKEVLWEES